MRTVEVQVTGRVQGVGFRAWARDEARRRGLSGWVRNEPDGSVTALVSGSAEAVEDMLRALHEGPLAAAVDDVRWTRSGAPAPEGFELRR